MTLESSYQKKANYQLHPTSIGEANIPVPMQPIPAASDRLDSALFQLRARLETITDKLTPVLHAQNALAKNIDEPPASDVGLVRQLDDATARVWQVNRGLDDLIERLAI